MRIILDTGPLVALLNRRDRHHEWAANQWSRITPPLFTCEAVLAEACFLVQSFPGAQGAVLDLVERSVLDLSFHLDDETTGVSSLLQKDRNAPMSLADGCLVRMAELYEDGVVLTLDSDFGFYRKHGRKVIPRISPD